LTRLAGQVAEAVEEPGPVPTFNPTTPPRIVLSPLEVIHKSLFGPASTEDWHPLSLATFFSEGWDEPFVRSPEGTNEAPKQIWFGAASGVFVRLYTLNFFYTNGLTANRGLLLRSGTSWAGSRFRSAARSPTCGSQTSPWSRTTESPGRHFCQLWALACV
jgi:hypothetical protein